MIEIPTKPKNDQNTPRNLKMAKIPPKPKMIEISPKT